MVGFVVRQVRGSWGRSVVLGCVVLVASLSFVGLQAVAVAGETAGRGLVASSFATSYDILVRPVGSQTALEVEQGLVRANFLSGVFGGISFEQLEAIRAVEGVEVAAPVANVGYVTLGAEIEIALGELVTDAPVQLFRVSQEWVAEAGLSRYADRDLYVYVTTVNPIEYHIPRTGEVFTEWNDPSYDPDAELNIGRQLRERVGPHEAVAVCAGVAAERGSDLVFGLAPRMSCFSTLSPDLQLVGPDGQRRSPSALNFFYPPVLLAAIDPVAEAALLGLDEAVVEGRYLHPGEESFLQLPAGEEPGQFQAEIPTVPVIASTDTFVSERLDVTIERLVIEDAAVTRQELSAAGAVAFLEGLESVVVDRRSYDPEPAYDGMVDRLADAPSTNGVDQVWVTEPVSYAQLGDRLRPEMVDIAAGQLRPPDHGWLPRSFPPSTAEVDFRQVFQRRNRTAAYPVDPGQPLMTGPLVSSTHVLGLVGRFDPGLLAGFSELSQVPLQSYYPPTLTGADATSRRLLGDETLLPTMDLGSYIAQPPLLLTTLEAARGFYDARNYQPLSPDSVVSPLAPISSIRVRVADVDAPTAEAEARIEGVAAAIRDATGLDVDVTIGSSPTQVTIELPAGDFGRPQLTLAEDWVAKGVSFAVIAGLDRKSAALFVVVQLLAGLVIATAAMTAVRSRRAELATLRALGWSTRTLFGVVLGELVVIGLAAGLVGTVVAAAAVTAADLPVDGAAIAATAPIAALLAGVAGLAAAASAARTTPTAGLAPPLRARATARPVRTLTAMAARTVTRLPARTLLAAAALTVAVAAMTTLAAINLGYRGLLVDTRLGVALSDQIRPVDYAVAALALVFAAVAIAQIIYLGLRERANELATLAATGWSGGTIRRLAVTEAAIIAAIGAIGGIALGAIAATTYGGATLLPASLAAATATALAGTLATLTATVAITTHLTHNPLTTAMQTTG